MTVINPIRPGDGDPRHGTMNGYRNHKCRCSACREANRLCFAQAKQKRRAAPDKPHGTVNGYFNWGCRCDQCRRAAGFDPERVKLLAQRRDQAIQLIAQGLTVSQIATKSGLSHGTVARLFKSMGIQPPKGKPATRELKLLARYADLPNRVARYERQGDDRFQNRDALIVTCREQGFTLDRIGSQLGISRERIRQLIKEFREWESAVVEHLARQQEEASA